MVKLVGHKQVSYSFHTLDYAVHKSTYITRNIKILNFRISIKQRKGILSEFADFFFFFFFCALFFLLRHGVSQPWSQIRWFIISQYSSKIETLGKPYGMRIWKIWASEGEVVCVRYLATVNWRRETITIKGPRGNFVIDCCLVSNTNDQSLYLAFPLSNFYVFAQYL